MAKRKREKQPERRIESIYPSGKKIPRPDKKPAKPAACVCREAA